MRSLRVVPEDDLLVLVAAGGRGDVAEDHADLGRLELDGEVLLARTLRDAIPAGADLEARALVEDAVVGCVLAATCWCSG